MSWADHPDNQCFLRGLDQSIEMIQRTAAAVADEHMDTESMIVLSIKLDYLLMAFHALAEANSSAGLDDELSQLFQGE
jgi:hypothetical protein